MSDMEQEVKIQDPASVELPDSEDEAMDTDNPAVTDNTVNILLNLPTQDISVLSTPTKSPQAKQQHTRSKSKKGQGEPSSSQNELND
jgi:hypothetical protein